MKETVKYFGCTFWVVTNGDNFDVRPPRTGQKAGYAPDYLWEEGGFGVFGWLLVHLLFYLSYLCGWAYTISHLLMIRNVQRVSSFYTKLYVTKDNTNQGKYASTDLIGPYSGLISMLITQLLHGNTM